MYAEVSYLSIQYQACRNENRTQHKGRKAISRHECSASSASLRNKTSWHNTKDKTSSNMCKGEPCCVCNKLVPLSKYRSEACIQKVQIAIIDRHEQSQNGNHKWQEHQFRRLKYGPQKRLTETWWPLRLLCHCAGVLFSWEIASCRSHLPLTS